MVSLFESEEEKNGPLSITVHPDDKNVDYNETVLIECGTKGNVTRYVWYKDGVVVKNTDRIMMSSTKIWHTLKINSVTVHDSGIYTFTAFNGSEVVGAKALLFVGPPGATGYFYYLASFSQHVTITSPFPHVQVPVGEEIKLTVTLEPVAFTYHWFKSNSPIKECSRIKIYEDPNCTQLVIEHAELTDTGVYYIVINTSMGVASAVTSVVVSNHENLTFLECRVKSVIQEALPEEVEFIAGDQRALMCRANIDQNTTVEWLKDNVVIKPTNNLRIECIFAGNLGLSFMEVSEKDAGEYSLVLKNSKVGIIDKSSCFVSVSKRMVQESSDEPTLLRPLQSVMACVGARVSFECSFDLRAFHQYYYVVWYVGKRRVERTNNTFCVVTHKGNFILAIKYVDPSMNGDITCELRRAELRRRSYVVGRTSAQLAIVPLLFIELNQGDKEVTCKVLRETTRESYPWRTQSRRHVGWIHDPHHRHLRNEYHSSCKPVPYTEVFEMDVRYCRLDEDGFYFMEVKNYGSENLNPRAVVDDDEELSNEDDEKVIVLEWESHPNIHGFRVSLLQPDGMFYEAGMVTEPQFTLRHSDIEKMYTFRICAMKIDEDDDYDLSVCLIDPKYPADFGNYVTSKAVSCFPEPFNEYVEIMGAGAFGQVLLVHNDRKEYFAAKVIRTMSDKRRAQAAREFELLRTLHHPKIVSLKDAFHDERIYVLVMEYLWGGELFERVVEEDYLTEHDVIYYVRQIASGLKYIHNQSIVHLDIKPENIVCISPNSRRIKIIDFGLARGCRKHSKIQCVYGTKDYMAPEILNYDHISVACDMWGLGVVTYLLLSGTMPFRGKSWAERSVNITLCRYDYKDYAFEFVSYLARDFVNNLLVLNDRARMTAKQALAHPWLANGPPDGRSARMTVARHNMKDFLTKCKNKWMCAGTAVRATFRFRHMTTKDDGRSRRTVPPAELTYTVAELPGA